MSPVTLHLSRHAREHKAHLGNPASVAVTVAVSRRAHCRPVVFVDDHLPMEGSSETGAPSGASDVVGLPLLQRVDYKTNNLFDLKIRNSF